MFVKNMLAYGDSKFIHCHYHTEANGPAWCFFFNLILQGISGHLQKELCQDVTSSASVHKRTDCRLPTIDRDSARNGIENHKMDPQSSSYLFSPVQTFYIYLDLGALFKNANLIDKQGLV